MNPDTPKRGTLLPHLLLLAVVLVWGTTFPLVKAALRDVSPLLFNLLRMAFAALLLLAVNARTLKGISRRDLLTCALVGLLLALGYQLQTTGLARTTPTRSAFLTGLVVVLVPLFSVIPGVARPGSPRPSFSTFLGAFLAFAGVVLLTAPAHTQPSTPQPAHTHPGSWAMSLFSGLGLGEWLTIGCALAFAAHLLTIARAAPSIPARRLGTLQIAFAALFMLFSIPLEVTFSTLFFRPTPTVLLALAITAIFATAAAFTIQSYAQERLPASHVALVFTLEPVFAWLTSLVFLREHLSPRALAGAGLILLGILVVELWPTSTTARPVSVEVVSVEGSTL